MDGQIRRRRLPHWDVDRGTYFVTACLEGSIPARGWLRFWKFREQLDSKPQPAGMTEDEWEHHKNKLAFGEFDKLLDFESAIRHLANPDAAAELERNLRFFAGDRYDLIAYVVMPSHFHWVFRPWDEWVESVRKLEIAEEKTQRTPRQRIMQSVKGFSARQIKSLLGLEGEFWQMESYDHVVRGDDELARIIEYIENNPVKAGLCGRQEDWRWSSAAVRVRLNLNRGDAIPKVG